MSKKKSKFKPGNSFPDFLQSVEFLHNACLEAFSAGRIRRAFLCLKDLLSHKDFSLQSLPLAGQILEQKMLQMHREGDDSQIHGMFTAVLAKAPGILEHIRPEYLVFTHWQEANSSFWAKYESDAKIKEQIDAHVLHLLRDPSELSNNKILPALHPLKQAAHLIITVWRALEQGDASRLEELNCAIGRHSPFVAWRLFLNALHCYYSGQAGAALENLGRISKDSPLFKVADELAGLTRNAGKADSEIQEMILRETQDTPLLKRVTILEDSLGKKLSTHQRQELVTSVFSEELHKNSPLLYLNLGSLFYDIVFTRSKNKDAWLEILIDINENSRMLLLANHQEKKEKLADWMALTQIKELSNLEQALIHDWIATLYSLKLNPENSEMFFFRQPMEPAAAEYLYSKMEFHWRKSTQLHPLQETFSKWHIMSEAFLSPAQSDEILESWLDYFPDDVNVFLKLLESARKRKVYSKAASQLKRLREVAPNHHSLTLAGELLELETTLGCLEKKRINEAIQHIDKFSPASCLFISAFQNYVRILAKIPGVTLEYPLIARHLKNTMERNKFTCQTKITLQPEKEYEAEKFFTEFESILSQCDVIWGDFWLSGLHYPEKGLKNLGRISSERLWSLCRFFLECASSYQYGHQVLAFLWSLTAEGLSRQDNLAGAFLFLRGYLLYSIYITTQNFKVAKSFKERIVNIFAAANKYLRKKGNLDPLKNLEQYLKNLNFPMKVFNEISDTMGLNKAGKIVKQEVSAPLAKLLQKCYLTEDSNRQESEKEYPRLLDDYKLFENSLFGDEDDDFDEDDYDDDYDDDDYDFFPGSTPAELLKMLEALHAASRSEGSKPGKNSK